VKPAWPAIAPAWIQVPVIAAMPHVNSRSHGQPISGGESSTGRPEPRQAAGFCPPSVFGWPEHLLPMAAPGRCQAQSRPAGPPQRPGRRRGQRGRGQVEQAGADRNSRLGRVQPEWARAGHPTKPVAAKLLSVRLLPTSVAVNAQPAGGCTRSRSFQSERRSLKLKTPVASVMTDAPTWLRLSE
jgi:hypothetical protein